MFKKNKSQVSIEFLMIFGISFIIVMTIVGIFFSFSAENKSSLDVEYLNKVGNQIISEVENIYFLGIGNRITLNINMPSGISNITILNKTNTKENFNYNVLQIKYLEGSQAINLSYLTKNPKVIRFDCTKNCTTNNDVTYWTDIEVLNPGPKILRIENKGKYVNLEFVR